jgi:hypothetical protein
MDAAQKTRQAQACHIRFKQCQADGFAPAGLTVYDYAFQLLGRHVDSLKSLEDWELNALRDRLEGKPNKILEKLNAAATDAGIDDLAGWMKHASVSSSFAYLRGHTPETLPLGLQWRLARCLLTRGRVNRPAPRARKLEATLF